MNTPKMAQDFCSLPGRKNRWVTGYIIMLTVQAMNEKTRVVSALAH